MHQWILRFPVALLTVLMLLLGVVPVCFRSGTRHRPGDHQGRRPNQGQDQREYYLYHKGDQPWSRYRHRHLFRAIQSPTRSTLYPLPATGGLPIGGFAEWIAWRGRECDHHIGDNAHHQPGQKRAQVYQSAFIAESATFDPNPENNTASLSLRIVGNTH